MSWNQFNYCVLTGNENQLEIPLMHFSEKKNVLIEFCVIEVSGRGRGIMETVDPSLKLPKGRGYAPPGMGK